MQKMMGTFRHRGPHPSCHLCYRWHEKTDRATRILERLNWLIFDFRHPSLGFANRSSGLWWPWGQFSPVWGGQLFLFSSSSFSLKTLIASCCANGLFVNQPEREPKLADQRVHVSFSLGMAKRESRIAFPIVLNRTNKLLHSCQALIDDKWGIS